MDAPPSERDSQEVRDRLSALLPSDQQLMLQSFIRAIPTIGAGIAGAAVFRYAESPVFGALAALGLLIVRYVGALSRKMDRLQSRMTIGFGLEIIELRADLDVPKSNTDVEEARVVAALHLDRMETDQPFDLINDLIFLEAMGGLLWVLLH